VGAGVTESPAHLRVPSASTYLFWGFTMHVWGPPKQPHPILRPRPLVATAKASSGVQEAY
jgi:hypothetical protein